MPHRPVSAEVLFGCCHDRCEAGKVDAHSAAGQVRRQLGRGAGIVFICVSTECFPDLAPQEVLEVLVDLGYTSIELPIHEQGGWRQAVDTAGGFVREWRVAPIEWLDDCPAAAPFGYRHSFLVRRECQAHATCGASAAPEVTTAAACN